jgi:hypothetical protein
MNYASDFWFNRIGPADSMQEHHEVTKENSFSDRFFHNPGLFQGGNPRKIRACLET